MKDVPSNLQIGRAKKAYFKAARNISKLSNHRCKIGCVVVNGHRIISSGHNSATKTHALQTKIDKEYFSCDCAGYLHAETDALISLINSGINLSRATVYVYRSMRNGEMGMARPCPRCMGLIKKLGIKKINYSTPEGFAEETVL